MRSTLRHDLMRHLTDDSTSFISSDWLMLEDKVEPKNVPLPEAAQTISVAA